MVADAVVVADDGCAAAQLQGLLELERVTGTGWRRLMKVSVKRRETLVNYLVG